MKPRKRDRVTVEQTDLTSLTQQHHARGATPAEIVATYARTGMINQRNRQPIPELPSQSYHEMLNMVADVKFAFESYPAPVRRRFSNDPFMALRFVEDPKNALEALKLGMLTPEAAERVLASEAEKTASPPKEPPAT